MSTYFRIKQQTFSYSTLYCFYWSVHAMKTLPGHSRFSSVLMLGRGMKAIRRLLHGQSSCDSSSDLINLHSILSQNQSPSAGVVGMGCLVKPRGHKRGCPVPAERWSSLAEHTPSELEASTTLRFWINDVDELINQRWACLQLPALLC